MGKLIVVLALSMVVEVAPTHAAHPLLTEDPGTQGKGHAELELGFAADHGDPSFGGRGTLFSPQISYGVTDRVDVIVQGAWQTQTPAGARAVRGIANTAVDIKWRLRDDGGPLTFAVRGGVDLPTGDDAKGLGGGEVGAHVVAVTGWSEGPISVYANAGYARVRQPGLRPNIGFFSVAVTGPEGRPLRTFVEAATYSNTDPAKGQWPAVARTGLLYSVNQSLDVDVGFQARLNRGATRAAWLAGATLRW